MSEGITSSAAVDDETTVGASGPTNVACGACYKRTLCRDHASAFDSFSLLADSARSDRDGCVNCLDAQSCRPDDKWVQVERRHVV